MSDWTHWRKVNREGMVTDVVVDTDEDFSDRGWARMTEPHSSSQVLRQSPRLP